MSIKHTYAIISSGFIVEGYARQEVYTSMAQLVNVPAEKLLKWFDGSQRSITKGLSKTQAAQYQQKFRDLGLVSQIQLTPSVAIFDQVASTSNSSQDNQQTLTQIDIDRTSLNPSAISLPFSKPFQGMNNRNHPKVTSSNVTYSSGFLIVISFLAAFIIQNYTTTWLSQNGINTGITIISIFILFSAIALIYFLLPNKKTIQLEFDSEKIELIDNPFDFKHRSFTCKTHNDATLYQFSYDYNKNEYVANHPNNIEQFRLTQRKSAKFGANKLNKDMFESISDFDEIDKELNLSTLMQPIRKMLGMKKNNQLQSTDGTHQIYDGTHLIAKISFEKSEMNIQLISEHTHNENLLYAFFIYLSMQAKL